MIDLHVHTNHSGDGEHSVIEILKMAEKSGVKYLSITDHDVVSAYEDLKNININKHYTGKIIPGIEMTTTYQGVTIELLGYGIDIDKVSKSKLVGIDRLNRVNQLEWAHIRKISTEFNLLYDSNQSLPKNGFPTPIFYKELISYKQNIPILKKLNITSEYNFYRHHVCNINSPFFFNREEVIIPFDKASELIRKNGGKVFLAHPFIYSFSDTTKTIKEINNTGLIDGIECFHSSHDEEKIDYLIELCNKHNLLKSGGSDFHTSLQPRIIGYGNDGKIPIPFELSKEWLEELKSKCL